MPGLGIDSGGEPVLGLVFICFTAESSCGRVLAPVTDSVCCYLCLPVLFTLIPNVPPVFCSHLICVLHDLTREIQVCVVVFFIFFMNFVGLFFFLFFSSCLVSIFSISLSPFLLLSCR